MLALLIALASLTAPARAQGVEGAIVSVGRIAIEGEGTSELAVRRVITRHLADVRACWAVGHVSAALPLALTITADGRVEDARATLDGIDGGIYAACVADAARRWRFPARSSAAARGAVRVSMSLQVRAGSPGYGGEPPHGFRRRHAESRVRVARPTVVEGSIPRDAIARVIHRHENELRFCYEQGLTLRPDLAGTIGVTFLVATTGAVASSTIASTTLAEPRVEACVQQAFRRWQFPAEDQGITAVRVEIRFSITRR